MPLREYTFVPFVIFVSFVDSEDVTDALGGVYTLRPGTIRPASAGDAAAPAR